MRKLLNAAAVVAALGTFGAASAQTTDDLYPYGITLRGGIAFPLDRNLADVGNTLLNIGGEYELRRSFMREGESYISADYFFKSLGGGGRGSVIPVMLNHRMYTSLDELRSYYFFGIGVAFVNVGGNGAALAVRGGVGKELGPRVIAEAALIVSGKAGGASANALTLNLGYRF